MLLHTLQMLPQTPQLYWALALVVVLAVVESLAQAAGLQVRVLTVGLMVAKAAMLVAVDHLGQVEVVGPQVLFTIVAPMLLLPQAVVAVVVPDLDQTANHKVLRHITQQQMVHRALTNPETEAEVVAVVVDSHLVVQAAH
jgi:hypothetical protein